MAGGVDERSLTELEKAQLEAQRVLAQEKRQGGASAAAVEEDDVMNPNRARKQNIKVSEMDLANIPKSRKDREREEAARRKVGG